MYFLVYPLHYSNRTDLGFYTYSLTVLWSDAISVPRPVHPETDGMVLPPWIQFQKFGTNLPSYKTSFKKSVVGLMFCLFLLRRNQFDLHSDHEGDRTRRRIGRSGGDFVKSCVKLLVDVIHCHYVHPPTPWLSRTSRYGTKGSKVEIKLSLSMPSRTMDSPWVERIDSHTHTHTT